MATLENKVIIVTGAAGGIGRAIAEEAGREGARLALVDSNEDSLVATAAAIRSNGAEVLTCAIDITNRVSWQQRIGEIAAHFGAIDAMVNNAMWVKYEPIAEVCEEVYRHQMSVGLDAVYWGIQAVEPHMTARGAGRHCQHDVTRLGARHSERLGVRGRQGAISALTRQCAVELGQKGIRVNAVAPGPMPTPGTMRVVDEEGWRKRLARSPLGRLSTPEGVARLVVFLASDAADCINGDVVFADGGRSISAM